MEPYKIHRTTQPLVHAQGLEGKEISSPSGRGRKMSLTSPLIDQDVSPSIVGINLHSREVLGWLCFFLASPAILV
jgi:hypothetical protein